MKNFKKALSLLLAVMMIIGTLMPVFAAETEHKTTVVIHKMKIDTFGRIEKSETYEGDNENSQDFLEQ